MPNAFALGLLAAAALAHAAERDDRHHWSVGLDAAYAASASDLGAWTKGGLGKLRYDEDDDGLTAGRVFAEYRGRITPTLWSQAVVDYVGDASPGVGVTEVHLDWRPIPRSKIQQQWRFGAFYPPLSLENSDVAWRSPFSSSSSAINTWLGEEIRPVGAEWSARRRLGSQGSPHELGAFGAVFYGNDPAGTLLFWRGWALHDRQTRLNDHLPIPPQPVWDAAGAVVGLRDQWLEPFHEIDHRPGLYAGLEWRYARRALVQFSRYDNRADPYAFSGGQWAWRTAFDHVAAQLALPGDVGLVAQWMSGATYWLAGAGADGLVPQGAALVEDAFDARFVMITKSLRAKHRLSVRYDGFGIAREHAVPAFRSDAGHAWTLAYRYRRADRFDIGVEWMRISSAREVWEYFYDVDERATERMLRIQLGFSLARP